MNNWNREVKAKAIELIEQGVPPYDAMDKARDIVSEQRKQKARQAIASRLAMMRR